MRDSLTGDLSTSRDSAFWPQVKINPPTRPPSGELAVEFSVTRTKWLVEKGEAGLRTLVRRLNWRSPRQSASAARLFRLADRPSRAAFCPTLTALLLLVVGLLLASS